MFQAGHKRPEGAGRRAGTPNRSTVETRAELKAISDITGLTGPIVLAHAMTYFFNAYEGCLAAARIPGLTGEEQCNNINLAEEYLEKAANFAKDLAPYEAPRLSSVRVGGSGEAPLTVNLINFAESDCITLEEYRAEQAKLLNGGNVREEED